MTHTLPVSLLTGALLACLARPALTAEPVDADYLAFLNARGEAPWIAANADHARANDAFRPIPALSSFPADTAKRDLGFALFHDTSLSRDGSVGCNTCHMGMMGGIDGLALARGIDGEQGLRNTPTIFNAAFNFRQFWDGRAFDLDEQALGPITNPVEMGHDLDRVVASLKADARYAALFAAAYPDGVTAANLGNALAQHTKDMTRTDSAFNTALAGDMYALTEQAQRGKERFTALGCVACHNGINVGGNSYQPVAARFTTALQYALPGEEGLFARSGREQDRLVFRVPSLHNVAVTAPYYHDGSVPSLADAIRRMGAQQAGRTLSDSDVADIEAFLGSLTSGMFASGMPMMGGEHMQEMMRNQMPDRAGARGTMPGGSPADHQQHMQHMQHMQQGNMPAMPGVSTDSVQHDHTH